MSRPPGSRRGGSTWVESPGRGCDSWFFFLPGGQLSDGHQLLPLLAPLVPVGGGRQRVVGNLPPGRHQADEIPVGQATDRQSWVSQEADEHLVCLGSLQVG